MNAASDERRERVQFAYRVWRAIGRAVSWAIGVPLIVCATFAFVPDLPRGLLEVTLIGFVIGFVLLVPSLLALALTALVSATLFWSEPRMRALALLALAIAGGDAALLWSGGGDSAAGVVRVLVALLITWLAGFAIQRLARVPSAALA